MKPETAQWVRYAEEDLEGARDMPGKTPPLRNLACFYCQQSAESTGTAAGREKLPKSSEDFGSL